MPDRPKVDKATIIKIKPSGALDQDTALTCHFNPKEFEISRQIKWVERTSIGSDAPQVTFAGGEAQDMTVVLLFDTTDTGKDVRKSYKTLLDIAAVDKQQENTQTKKGAPAHCQFQWGKFLSFTAVIRAIKQRFTMFKADGTPVRAKVTVTFAQIGKKPKKQNPTSYSEPRKIWVVHEGQRLDWIAYQEYGDPAHWRHIAVTNGLANPRALHPGQVLKLVPLP